MLTDRVVVESEVLGQLDHIDRAPSVDDVPEQVVPRRITERTSLQLQPAHASIVYLVDTRSKAVSRR